MLFRSIDFYPCKYKEEDIDVDNYRQSFQCYLPEYNECLEDVRMEFKEKLQLLRTNMKLSQEELVNRLYLWSGKP